MLSVFVVEDDPLLARHVREAIESASSLHFAGHADRLAQARIDIARVRPTVVLSDLGLPDGDGATLIEEIKRQGPDGPDGRKPPHILVFSVFGEEGHVLRAIEAGADGYLLKGCTASELTTAIEQAARGESPISPAIARYLLKHFRPGGSFNGSGFGALEPTPAYDAGSGAGTDEDTVTRLTAREIAVLRLVAQGYVTEEIGDKLSITSHTVASHIRNIYEKLQVHKRAQAVSEAQRRGWLR